MGKFTQTLNGIQMESTEVASPHFFKDFLHARKLMKTTSRGKNPDWYRDAISLSHQLHLFAGVTEYRAFYKDFSEEGQWKEAATIPNNFDEDVLEQYLNEFRSEYLSRSTRSLGVVLHLNKDASVFEFPEQDWEEEYPGLSVDEVIKIDPSAVLQDRTLSAEDMTFRVYPVPASPQADISRVAVASNRHGENLLAAFRELGSNSNFPIRTQALSSPLLLLSRLPRTFGPQETAFCTLLRYDSFSFCSFFDTEGELILLRSLRHSQGELPPNLETVLATTAASVEISEMTVKAFDCRLTTPVPLEDELSRLLFQLPFQVFLPPTDQNSEQYIELSVYEVTDDNPGLGFGETETFGTTISEGYHLQDFFSPSQAELASLPGVADMKILRLGRGLGRIGLAACLGFAAYVGIINFKKTSSAEWKSNANGAKNSTNLTAEISKLTQTEKLLSERSKGWVAMELCARLFPSDGSVQFSSAEYSAVGDSGFPQGGAKGFSKKWVIRGLATQSATQGALSRVNSQEGMAEVFEKVRIETGSNSMDMSPNSRNLSVNLNLSENPNYEPSAPQGSDQFFAYTFDLDLTQRIEASDPLSVPTSKL